MAQPIKIGDREFSRRRVNCIDAATAVAEAEDLRDEAFLRMADIERQANAIAGRVEGGELTVDAAVEERRRLNAGYREWMAELQRSRAMSLHAHLQDAGDRDEFIRGLSMDELDDALGQLNSDDAPDPTNAPDGAESATTG